MKVKLSPLRLIKFQVSNFTHKTIINKNVEDSEGFVEIDLYNYIIDLDFDQYSTDQDFLIEMQMHINKKKAIGYELKVDAFAQFQIEDQSDITERMKGNLLSISSVNIMISNIRGYLKNVTSYGTFGAYLLPSIDITDLFSQKIKKQENKASKNK